MSTAPPTARRMKPAGGRGYPAYTEYVPSDIPGVAELPAHWCVKPLKRVVTINAEDLPEATDPDYEIAYVDIGNVTLVGGIESTEVYRFEEAPSRARRKVRDGDTIISTVRTYLRAVARIRDPAPHLVVSTGFAVLRPNSEIDAGFLYRLVQCEEFVGRVVACSTGVSYPAIAPTMLGTFHVWLPPLPEQRAIAAFLDHETRRIDELIAKKRRLIELLTEKRAALISHAVTKGLNPAAPIKPSGMDWLGDVPAHWEVKRLRFAMTSIEQGWSPQCDNRHAEEDEWGVLKVGCVNGVCFDESEHKALPVDLEPIARYEIKCGDVLMSRANTRELLGSAAYVDRVRPRLMLCDKLYRIRVTPNQVDPRFITFAFRSGISRFQFERDAEGASGSMKNVGQDSIKNLWVPLPPIREQCDIVTAIDRDVSRLDKLVGDTSLAIGRVFEYRSALISAAVTGKIDVREEA